MNDRYIFEWVCVYVYAYLWVFVAVVVVVFHSLTKENLFLYDGLIKAKRNRIHVLYVE